MSGFITGNGSANMRERSHEREREREREVWPGWPANPTRTRDCDPAFSPDSGHLTSRAWYWSEAWKPTVLSSLSSSPKTDQNVGDLSSKLTAKARFCSRQFRRSLAHFQLGSTPHVTSIIFWPTLSPETARLPAINHLGSSWFWKLDLSPLPRVGGHRRQHWTHWSLNYQTWASRRRRLNSGDRWLARVFW